jgi:hypothetical protein
MTAEKYTVLAGALYKYLGSLNILDSFIAYERPTGTSMQGYSFSSKHKSHSMMYLGGDYIRKDTASHLSPRLEPYRLLSTPPLDAVIPKATGVQ